MKNILLYLSCFILVLGTSCTDEEDNPDRFSKEGGIVNFTNIAPGLIDFAELDLASASFTIESDGAPVSGVKLLKSYNGGTPIEVQDLSSFPVSFDYNIDQLISGLGISKSDLALGDNISFSFSDYTAEGNNYASASRLALPVTCVSLLEGEYETTTTGIWCDGTSSTATVTWTESDAGEYEISDWSYGSYPVCYGGTQDDWGTLRLVDFCNKLSVEGEDAFGDAWSLSNLVVDGNNLTFSWSNTYGEAGVTTVVNPDGWPPLSL